MEFAGDKPAYDMVLYTPPAGSVEKPEWRVLVQDLVFSRHPFTSGDARGKQDAMMQAIESGNRFLKNFGGHQDDEKQQSGTPDFWSILTVLSKLANQKLGPYTFMAKRYIFSMCERLGPYAFVLERYILSIYQRLCDWYQR
jgi:hypothetical protein